MCAETSRIWDGNTEGDAADNSADDFSLMLSLLVLFDRTIEGVLYTNEAIMLNKLAVTNPSGLTISTAPGVAVVDGTLYTNTSTVNKSMAVAPGAGFKGYRLVLQKDWALQRVRIVLLGPTVGAYPALTQTDGVTWEISLATITQNPASVVITDDRNYYNLIHPFFHVDTADAVTQQSSAVFQTGKATISLAASSWGQVTVTLPIAYYSNDYVVVATLANTDVVLVMNTYVNSTSQFTITALTGNGGNVTKTVTAQWWAIGSVGAH